MTDWERDRLIGAVRAWAEAHPTPEEPVLSLSDQEFCPMDIGRLVGTDEPAGRWLMKFFEHGVAEHGLEDVVDGLEQEGIIA